MSNQITTNELVQVSRCYGFGQQRIIETSNGILFTCQINGDNEVEVYRSANEGATWVLDTTFDSLTGPFQLSMCRSERNDIFLCFTNNFRYIVVKKRDYSAGTWSEILNQEHSATTGGFKIPALITYNKYVNRLHVFWVTNNRGSGGTGYILSQAYTDDYGSNFTFPTGTQTSTGSLEPGLFGLDTRASDGRVFICFTNQDSTQQMSRLYCSSNGSGFSGSSLNYGYYTSNLGFLINASNQEINFLLHQRSGFNHKLQVYINTTAILDYDLGAQNVIALGEGCCGCDNQGNIYIFYVKVADKKCYYRKYDVTESTWSDEAEFSSVEGRRPSCVQQVINAGNKLRVIYTTP